MSRYQEGRATRREAPVYVGRTKTCKLNPVMCVPVRPSEAGMVGQSITMELDPIAGRMITPLWAEFISVFVPVQAIDALKDPAAAYAGMTEVLRTKLLTGAPLFNLETEGEITKRCQVNPVSIAGVKKTNEIVRIAHNVAVNFLRRRLYEKAAQILHSNTAVTPALLSSTVLQRFNGVLDPDDHINGKVSLSLPTMNLPVKNLHVAQNSGAFTEKPVGDTGLLGTAVASTTRAMHAKESATAGTVDPIYALFSGAAAGGVSLDDFYNAEKMDQFTRIMRKMVDDDPEYGEENVLRWAHGLDLANDKVPFVIAERRQMFGRDIVPAMDTAGVTAETMRSDLTLTMAFQVPVPKTELGGVIITFIQVKPDETVLRQPHPILSEPWGIDNFLSDELMLDPQPVTMRQLFSDVAAGSEATVAFYTGLNELKRYYSCYGLSPALDPLTVEHKTAVWTYPIPLSVTPDNILYPDAVLQYPFADQNAEVVTFTVVNNVNLVSPMIFGPTPVETLALIAGQDLFNEVP